MAASRPGPQSRAAIASAQATSSGSSEANHLRAELFKQHFLAEYSAARKQIAAPRVLFKFGDNHVAKGFRVLHERDLGNFVAEFTDGEKTQSVHVLVLGTSGLFLQLLLYFRSRT